MRRHRLTGPYRANLTAAWSQTVKAKSSAGALGRANSSRFLLRKPSTGIRNCFSLDSANGLTVPFAWLPADYASKRPRFVIRPSARVEHAELPVQMNRTL